MESVKKILRTVRDEVYRIGNEIRLVSPDQIYDEDWYERMANDPQLRADVEHIVNVLYQEFQPASVIDLGCGVGHYLNSFQKRGASIHGVEGAVSAFNHLQVPKSTVEHHDLRTPYSTSDNYDLVVCFEVAEHLPESAAETLVDSITGCGQTVTFTAATPGQSGTHHINLQPHGYWIDLFEKRGYEYRAERTRELQEEMTVDAATWIPKNLMLFSR
ncbi:class I SAM-dependent methyltransferase [Halorussus halophilus]|uniref:class I SAM-dependent methyltransferase n=1 Tax=Halorussus halophilus TaxID=2650975 RepID=UPI00130116CF|nr:methyltransferase domain-containing protein [Halorussus halophilus]